MNNTLAKYQGRDLVVIIADECEIGTDEVIKSNPFQHWLSRMNQKQNKDILDLRSVKILSVDVYNGRICYIKVSIEVYYNGKRLWDVGFLQGAAVAILIVLTTIEDGEKYVLMVRQPRPPVGDVNCLELPAGMTDGCTNLVKKAMEEIREETGITDVKEEELVNLNVAMGMECGSGLYCSQGVLDEEITIFLLERRVNVEYINKINGAEGGIEDESEFTRVEVVPYYTAHKISRDMKLTTGLLFYERYIKSKET
ncbi:ADP-sugar diphosphatase [Acrasis kona]|uniref:ADP-sugar diphosphatase n=1 Tax=Acrasis kona TaxID=1008807 RepID=A0AAW2YKP4_9EUKA